MSSRAWTPRQPSTVPLIYIFFTVNTISLTDIIVLHLSQCQVSMKFSLSAGTPMVCPHFYPSTLVLISYSTPWSIRWKGCSSYRGLRLYDAQSDSYFPSTYAKFRGQTPCRHSLWPGRPNTLATTLGRNVLSFRCHS